MDKLLSENIEHEFFRGQLSLENESQRPDGKVVVERKGTLVMFEKWIRTQIKWNNEDEAVAVIVEPLKRVRKLRQGPAHKFEADKFSKEYETQQHEIVRNVYAALRNFRETLEVHPKAPKIKVPRWINEGKIMFS